MELLIWAALLLVLGLTLVILEILLPSGGLFGVLSVAAILGGIGLAFYNGGATAGFSFIIATAVALPIVLGLAFRWLPATPIGKRLLADAPTSQEVLPDNEERRALRALLGKIGHAKSSMLPSGAIEVEGRTFNAVSEGMAIEPGQAVRVIEVRGARVVVRPVVEGETAPPPDDILSRPIESLGLESFDDPLA